MGPTRRLSSSSVASSISSHAHESSPTIESPHVHFSRSQLKHINQQLSKLEPVDILRWSLVTFPRIFQTTAFGLTGLAITETLATLEGPLDSDIGLIFLDTLHHFPETLELVERVQKRYPHLPVHIFKPQDCESVQDFDKKYGERLWEVKEELYDYVVKVEPSQRAYAQLNVTAVITGRRRSQGGKRGDIDILEYDGNVLKINPMANWTFQQVQDFIKARNVPTNALLSKGYRSVGDWHSTVPVTESEDERAGRWKGRAKSECGIHNKKSRYAQFLQEQELKRQQEESAKLNAHIDSEMSLSDLDVGA